MSRTRVDMHALAWSLVQEALATRKRGDWRKRLAALARWRCAQLDFSPATRRLLRREIAGVLERVSGGATPTFTSS